MSRGWTFVSGDWNIHCDVCAKKIKASESRHRWDGYVVCADDWEERHPLDFVRAKAEKISVPFVRKNPDVFILNCNMVSRNGLVGAGRIGCMIIGNSEDISGLL